VKAENGVDRIKLKFVFFRSLSLSLSFLSSFGEEEFRIILIIIIIMTEYWYGSGINKEASVHLISLLL
jgi:hypothetical protein